MSDLITKTGIAQRFSRAGNSFQLDDGEWYSVFKDNTEKLNGATEGAQIEFVYKQNEKGGRTFNNIVGEVKILAAGAAPSAASHASPSPGAPALPQVGHVVLTRDRCIVRQNAVNVAAQIMQSMTFSAKGSLDAPHMASVCLQMAKQIEDYTSGDEDVKAAKEMVAEKKEAKEAGSTTIDLRSIDSGEEHDGLAA